MERSVCHGNCKQIFRSSTLCGCLMALCIVLCLANQHNMSLVILAGNEINFAITSDLIRLHMPVGSNLVCNKVKRVSPYTPCRSLVQYLGDFTNHLCQKEHRYCQLSSQIPVHMFCCGRIVPSFQTHQCQRLEAARHEYSVPWRLELCGDNSVVKE